MAIGSLITIVFQIARKDETETVGEGGWWEKTRNTERKTSTTSWQRRGSYKGKVSQSFEGNMLIKLQIQQTGTNNSFLYQPEFHVQNVV